jgi:hypothetical protein
MHCLDCPEIFDTVEEAYDHSERRSHAVYLPPTPLRSATDLDALYQLVDAVAPRAQWAA